MKSANPRRQLKYHNPKGLITNFLIKLDRGKPAAHPCHHIHQVPPIREKENRVFISPSPATTRKLQRLKCSASTNSRSRMIPAEIQQPSNRLKRASSNDCIVLSSDSEPDETPRVSAPKRWCIRAKEITATSVVTVPLTGDVSEVFDMGKINIDQSNFPHWLRDPSDDDSCDSDCSLVSTSALYHPKKRAKLSSDVPSDLPSPCSASFQLSLDNYSDCSSPANAFQNLSMEDSSAPLFSPALPIESSSSQSSLINWSTLKVQPSDDNSAPTVTPSLLDWSSLLTNPPYMEDFNLILSRRGLLSVVKRSKVCLSLTHTLTPPSLCLYSQTMPGGSLPLTRRTLWNSF